MMLNNLILNTNCIDGLKNIQGETINTCVTSPPYFGLRDYQVDGQIGNEKTPKEYIDNLVEVFREVRRTLKNDGTLWLNLGDTYVGALSQHKAGGGQGHNSCISKKTMSGIPSSGRVERNKALREQGLKPKDLIGIPWRVAFALQDDGWYLRSDIIWNKPNPMPESVKDRPTRAHEYIFLFSKSERYYYDGDAIKEDSKEGGRKNKRTVWSVPTKPFKGAHFAVYPEKLIEPCIIAGCPVNGTVLDPFTGSGTTAKMALINNRNFIGFEISDEYCKIAQNRILNYKYALPI